MEAAISFVLSNYTLTFLVAGLIHTAARRIHPKAPLLEDLFAPFLLWSIGVSFLYNFVMHVFFGPMSARFIGWEPSPFQAEVGFASLGFSLVGFLAWRGGRGLRIAAVAGPACFLLGAAAGHVVQIVRAENFSPGNAGIIFYTDILIPIAGLVMLALGRVKERSRGVMTA